MMAYGLREQRGKGHKYAEEDVCISVIGLNSGKHRSRRVRAHKRIYKKIARLMSKSDIRKDLMCI